MKLSPRSPARLLCALALATAALAHGEELQPAQVEVPAYAVDWSTADGGGGRSVAGDNSYALTGTIGQTDADPLQPSTGGAYRVDGGFWGGSSPSDDLFRDSFE